MEILKTAAVGVVQAVPANQWTMGVITFKEADDAFPGGLSLVTNGNRSAFTSALNGIQPGGSSDPQMAMSVAGFALIANEMLRTHSPTTRPGA